MKNNVLNEVFCKSVSLIKRNAPTILSICGAVGVVGTAISSGRATIQVEQKLKKASKEKGDTLNDLEVVSILLPAYIPTFLFGLSTITCILSANILNKRMQASIMSVYALADNTFKEYREKLIELHGEEIDQEVRGEIARSHYDYHVLGIEYPDRKVLWYEPYSDQYFEMFEREVMDAEYHLNRNFILGGSQPLNALYEMLNLPATKYGEKVGWCVCDGYMWIDFEHELQHKPDGTEYYILQPIFPPMTEDEMEECGYSL